MNAFLKISLAATALAVSATVIPSAATPLPSGKSAASPSSDNPNRLWYETPAAEWMEAMPLGNGRIGAMVYGGITRDRVALNEITMWAGQRDTMQNKYCGPERLAEIREAFFAGDIEKGNELTRKYLSGHSSSFGTHLPVGDLVIDFNGGNGAHEYLRELDLSTGVVSVTYSEDGTRYTREYICDYPDDVLAMRFTADKPGAVSTTISTDLLRESKITASDNGLVFNGKVDYPMFGPGGVNFSGNIKVVADGGSVSHTADAVKVDGANAVTVLVDIRTDFVSPAYASVAAKTVDDAAAKGFNSLKASHVADHSALFNRMDINFGETSNSKLPTDTRLRLAKQGVVDPSFDALFFQYGRYMQIASSRPNSPLCSNLQGIWNDNLACKMSWTCDYHLDININQNYWSANKANLAECNEPLFKYVKLLEKYGSETARDLYGCNGWCAHTVTNPWGYTAPGGDVSWGLNVTGGAWLATELWSHYLFTKDVDYLRNTGYPLLKSCAEFFMDYMVEDPNTGYLVTGPSISPENGFKLPDGRGYSASMMPTLDRAVVWQIYNACIESSKILGVDKKMRKRLEKDIKRLPPMMIAEDGQIKEWLLEGTTRQDPSHRHSSQLMGLYPFGQMSYDKTPELMAAARKAIELQTADPNWENTEWSCGNMLGFYAFLKDPKMAHFYLQDLFHNFTRENLMTVSPEGVALAPADIFSFDATEASVAGICDMLLQSHNGYLEFLPTLPEAWKTGSVKGICAQGALEADIDWADMNPTSIKVRSTKPSDFKVRVPAGMKATLDGKAVNLKPDADGLCSFSLNPGQNLNFEI